MANLKSLINFQKENSEVVLNLKSDLGTQVCGGACSDKTLETESLPSHDHGQNSDTCHVTYYDGTSRIYSHSHS